MSNTKTVMGQASNQYVKPLDITDVFSTYLYTANSTTLTANNGIDLAGEGGLVWIKNRDNVRRHALYDTERGVTKQLSSNLTDAERTMGANATITFNADGFSMPSGDADVNGNTGWGDYASWTFRKAPKFFDVVTWTGDGVAGKTINHNLGTTVGSIFVKRTSGADNWTVYHRGMDATAPEDYIIYLNTTEVRSNQDLFYDTAPTDSVFYLGSNVKVNGAGSTYVAYVFAHNDGDGGFGPSGDQDIIKCGSYTGNGSTNGTEVNLGWEPQWLLVKEASPGTSNWMLVDNMRGVPTGGNTAQVQPNTSNAETAAQGQLDFTATGFKLTHATSYNTSGDTYIYMAIRRGPLAQPESGTELFKVDAEDSASFNNPPLYVSGFPVDFALRKQTNSSANWAAVSRLTGTKWLRTNDTSVEDTVASYEFDFMDGWSSDAGWNAAIYSWMWKRAPGFCDVVAYTGDGVAGRTVSHNLGVAPEMMWVKSRDLNGGQWVVYHSGLNVNGEGNPETDYIRLNDAAAAADFASMWNDTAPTDSVFSLGNFSWVNSSSNTFIAYLFATLPGVSKVGSWSGTGGTNTQVIDCGFSAGARFVLIKRTNASQDWLVFDTVRGITSGNDAKLALNSTAAQSTANWGINPNSSGFEVTGNSINETGGEWIFYAIA